MTDLDDFWRLIEQARIEAPDAVAARAGVRLASRPADEIVSYAQLLWDLLASSYRADLWAAAYLINGGASDDGFEYFRGWLISQGQTVFEAAVADPDSLAGVSAVVAAAETGEELEDEDVLGIVWHAYRQATGQDLPAGSFTVRHPELDPDWNFDHDDDQEIRRRLPRLASLFLDDDSDD
jgi:Protein of unknown function (DUF4240)